MTDIEIIYKCVLDKTYHNKVEFLLEISKVSDRKLITGLLIDLTIRSKEYKIDRSEALQICSEVLSSDELNTEYIKDSINYYNELVVEINQKSLSKNNFLVEFLSTIRENDYSFDEKDIKHLLIENKEHLHDLKDILLENELYELIPLIDKYI